MNLKREEINLLDGIYTEDFGYIRFLKVSDLLKIGEWKYNQMMTVFAQNIDLYNIDVEGFNEFDLLMAKLDAEGNRVCFPDKTQMIDVLIESISLIYNIPIKDIVISDKHYCIIFKVKDKQVIIHRDNYSNFRDIILKSNMMSKMQKEPELKFKNEEIDRQYRSRVEEFLKYAKQDAERQRNSLLTIANIMMTRLKLYGEKNKLLSMTIHNLLYAYLAENEEEGYNKKYEQYLAGADPKKLDLSHWQVKIKDIINKED